MHGRRTAEGARVGNGAGPGTATPEAVAWVQVFTEGWANPVHADAFCDHFEPWFDDEVTMIQPSVRPVVGKRAFREEFARPLFDLVPDLHGTVENWTSSGDLIYIELRLEGKIGGRPFTMRTCDRITLRDGKAIERLAYLDPTPLVKAVLRHPPSWPKFIRMQQRSLRRPS
jgi:ketosteroid isomerase-like protein